MEFAEITKDPFKNKSNNFFLVVDIQNEGIAQLSGPGYTQNTDGILEDPSGIVVGRFFFMAEHDYVVVGSLSDEAFAHSFSSRRAWMLVPPNYTFSSFGAAVGFWLSPKEVEQFILGRLSLKGGD